MTTKMMNQTNQTNQTNPINQENNSPNFEKVLVESKNDLNKIEEEKVKKGRGRPKKLESSNIAGESKPVMVKVNPDEYKNFLKMFITFSGMYLAKATDFKGFEMNPEETEILASQGSELCVEYIPQLNSKYVKLGAFAVTAASVYGLKVMAYQAHQKVKLETSQKEIENKKNEVQTN